MRNTDITKGLAQKPKLLNVIHLIKSLIGLTDSCCVFKMSNWSLFNTSRLAGDL